MIDERLFTIWSNKETRIFRARKRKYPHFDQRISFNKNIAFFKNYFSNEANVSSHSFYPFIRMVIKIPRYKKTGEFNLKKRPIRELVYKSRPLLYSAHFDAFIYSWFSTVLTQKYEHLIKEYGIYENVIAYLEKEKSNIEFAHEVFEFVKEKGECTCLAFDVSSFFDGLDHEHLKKMWALVLWKDRSKRLPKDHFSVFKSITDYAFVEKESIESIFPELKQSRKNGVFINKICEPTDFRSKIRNGKMIHKNPFVNSLKNSIRFGKMCGIPQGSPISACLSNVYMIDFDIAINDLIQSLGGIYRRYCDDIIVVINSEDSDLVKKRVVSEIQKYQLEINEDKTETTVFKLDKNNKLRGFVANGNQYSNLQYLGFDFNGQNSYIRSSSMSRYYRRLSSSIRENLKSAYGNNSIGDKIFRRKLYNRFSDKGKRNFISYAKRASEHMNSDTIRSQSRNSLKKVQKMMNIKKKIFESKRNLSKVMK